ncbi:MAG: RNA polymerase sigma factor [Candidatus Cyclobacteriaceae bacterium M3_2C_046]
MPEDESILIQKLKKGDKKAFEFFFNKFYDLLFSVATQYLNNRDEAEEVVQEVFYRVWCSRENLQPHLSFKAYIYTIAKRLIYNNSRKNLVRITYEQHYKASNLNANNSLEEYLNFHELDQQINLCIEQLPPKRKEIFIMSRQQGLSHKEIAEKLHISSHTVESQIAKALKFIKESLALLLFFLMS